MLLDVIKSPIYPLMILPASQKDKPARDIEVIGTGPYKIGEWVKDSHLVITRFDDYVADTSAPGRDGYGGRKTVYLDAVRYRFMPEATTRIAALQNGEAQLISSVPSELGARVTQRKDLAIREVFPVLGSYIIVNSQQGLTDNPLIRQAIDAVVDVDEVKPGAMGRPRNATTRWSLREQPVLPGRERDEGVLRPEEPRQGQGAADQGRLQGRADRAADQQQQHPPSRRDPVVLVGEQMKAAGMNVKVDVVDWTTNARATCSAAPAPGTSRRPASCSNALLGPQAWRSVLYTFTPAEGRAGDGRRLRQGVRVVRRAKARQQAWGRRIEKRVLEQGLHDQDRRHRQPARGQFEEGRRLHRLLPADVLERLAEVKDR